VLKNTETPIVDDSESFDGPNAKETWGRDEGLSPAVTKNATDDPIRLDGIRPCE
jgi:hypothetical protein